MTRKKDSRYVTPVEAAEILGVDRTTIYKWCRSGLLKCAAQREGRGKRSRHMVLRSSLKGVFFKVCAHCGRTFECNRPRRAMFCSELCKVNHHEPMHGARPKRKVVPRRRRPVD